MWNISTYSGRNPAWPSLEMRALAMVRIFIRPLAEIAQRRPAAIRWPHLWRISMGTTYRPDALNGAKHEPHRSRTGVDDPALLRRAQMGDYYRAIFDATAVASIVLSPDGMVQSWSLGAEQLFGYSEDEVINRSVGFLTAPQHLGLGVRSQETGCPHDQSRHWDTLKCRSDGSLVDVSIDASPIRDSAGVSLGVVWIIRDISERVRKREEQMQRESALRHDALTDPLTGVGNRRRLQQALDAESNPDGGCGGSLTLVLADIDNLKAINDEFGHAAGDAALLVFTRLIQSHIRADDLLARYGGDEFIILMPGTAQTEAAVCVERMRAELEHARIPSLAHTLTASFGISECRAGESAESQLQRIDKALYLAKANGRNQVVQVSATKDGHLNASGNSNVGPRTDRVRRGDS
jgi:diguanylate cyclase (GGDEF)-like protein/PAS domain S-box-containing protein